MPMIAENAKRRSGSTDSASRLSSEQTGPLCPISREERVVRSSGPIFDIAEHRSEELTLRTRVCQGALKAGAARR